MDQEVVIVANTDAGNPCSIYVIVDMTLISSTCEQANGKGKKAKTAKITSWSIRADAVRKLDRGEPEPQPAVSRPDAVELSSDTNGQAPF